MDDEQYLKEVQKALEHDTTRLGDVYRLVKKGKSLPEIERKIHDHLRTIGHGGLLRKEWFLTNEQSIVSTAKLLGLKLHFELNLEMDD